MARYIDADALFKTVNRLFYSAFEVGSKESEKGRFRRGYNVAITDACEAITAAPTLESDKDYKNYCDALEKLAAYEDTGMEPEEVKEITSWSYGPFHKKMGDWLKAEREGRLVVLPCKVGDTVWEIGYDCKIDYEDMCAFPAPSCDECEFVKRVIVPVRVDSVTAATFLIGKIGTTAFFSFEEAEAALKGVSEDA